MEVTNTNTKSMRPDEPELDLYTIPSYSSWFAWDDIHEKERVALKEFFDGSSISRTPRIYKEYRDFIINKYREEPTRRLTFTEIRKALVGDVSLLQKVFIFLEKWGLINFHAPPLGDNLVVEDEERYKVKYEEGAPNGIRVVATPNSLKPISVPPKVGDGREAIGSGVKLPPLASFSDVFGNLATPKQLVCGNCGESCVAGHYGYAKGDLKICIKCFKNENYGENKSKDDFKLNGSAENIVPHGAVWTEAETLLLLESVLKHGDDWDLVAESVQTKSKLDCISKLIELPFGEFMLSSAHGKAASSGPSGIMNNVKQVALSSSEHQETLETENQTEEQKNENEQTENVVNESPPSKRKRLTSLSENGSSLMKQVALISTMCGPQITAAAAKAAVTALYDESSCPREIFDLDDDNVINGLLSSPLHDELGRVQQSEDSEMKERHSQLETEENSTKKDEIPLTLRIRTASATALGAAAAHAKLLADEEDREIEHLVATIIDAEVKKVNRKMKHFDELELIMEKEYAEIEELKESMIAERINVLKRSFVNGISKWRDNSSAKSYGGELVRPVTVNKQTGFSINFLGF